MSCEIQTYVFFDLETSGLPEEDHNRTKITEISMVAVKRTHLLETRPGAAPRVQNKVTLCLNPGRFISEEGSRITGLDNYLLEFEPYFNTDIFTIIDTFLNVLTPPICLIAHNGLRFDFPILKNHLEKLKVSLDEDLLCADSFHGFYNILKENQSDSLTNSVSETLKESVTEDLQSSTSSFESQTKAEDMEDYSSNMAMKAINETTPKANKMRVPRNASKARRQLPWGHSPRPNVSYKLTDIYERVLNRKPEVAHRAENDCILTLEISAVLAERFVQWVDENCTKFSDIEPMKLGVPLK